MVRNSMDKISNKPKEVALLIKFLYFELVLGLLQVWGEYDPITESMYVFLFILIVSGFVINNVIQNFSCGDKDAYKTIRGGSYLLIVIFFIITFLFNDAPIIEYLKVHQSFALFPLAGIINIIWLNSSVVKNWFTKQ